MQGSNRGNRREEQEPGGSGRTCINAESACYGPEAAIASPKISAVAKQACGEQVRINIADAGTLQAMRIDHVDDRQIAGGADWQGLIPGRPKDVIGAAFGATHYNDRAARAEALAGQAPVQHTEYTTELDYRLTPAPKVTVTPNLQYVSHVGGRAGEHAFVLGLKMIVGL